LIIRRPWPAMLRTIYGDQERYKKQYWSEYKGNYLTGDGARSDEDGYFWIVGRIDDVLNVAGHRLGTSEIESALVSHAKVAEAAVVGRPDELKGQGVVAFVTVKTGVDASNDLKAELREHVGTHIGAIAKPDEVRFAEALPKTRSGKIMRRLLKEIASGAKVTGDTTTLEDFSVLAKLPDPDEVDAVERRIRENDEADQDLLRKLSELQEVTPPPANLEAQTASISARRARLPEERAELVRARLGSSGASRIAKEKLVAAEEELSAIEKNIAKVRAEYEMRDRGFGDNIRAQQDAVRDAKQHHQVVEERKNPAYLNIGRHLASQGIAPPNAPHLLGGVRKHRVALNRHQQHNDELALLSRGIDKQELRQFYFSVVSVIALLAIILPLVAKSPRKREWLPQ